VSDESARAALRDALSALVERGETVGVAATNHQMATARLFDLARQLRDEQHPEANVAWIEEGGALKYVLAPSMH